MRISRLKLSKTKRKGQSPFSRFAPRALVAPILLFLSRFRFGLAFGLLGFLSCVGFICWHLGILERAEKITRDVTVDITSQMGYRFEDIFIQGRKTTSSADILDAVNLHRGDSIFKYSTAELKARLEAIAWIERADVQRYLPGIIKIDLKERYPVAVWQHQKQFYYVDGNGVVLQAKFVEAPKGLPVIVGVDAPQHVPRLLKLLNQYKEVKNQVTGMIRINKRRWDLVLSEKLTIKLPETQLEVALARLNFLLEAKKIDLEEVLNIDLRTPKRLIARVPPHTATRLKLKAKGEGV